MYSRFNSDRGPCVVVDSADTIIIVDSKNNRLQLVDRDYAFFGDVKVTITKKKREAMDLLSCTLG